MTTVANMRDRKGSATMTNMDVYIGRSGHGVQGYFGNPVRVGEICPECEMVHAYGGGTLHCFEQYARRRITTDAEYRTAVRGLYGKTLWCFCKPRPCHGDILAKLAEELRSAPPVLPRFGERWYVAGRHFDANGLPKVDQSVTIFTGEQPEPVVYLASMMPLGLGPDAGIVPLARYIAAAVNWTMGQGDKPGPLSIHWSRSGDLIQGTRTGGQRVYAVTVDSYNIPKETAADVILQALQAAES